MARRDYWPEQAAAILNLAEAEDPGFLRRAEALLRQAGEWPEFDEDGFPIETGEDAT